MRIVGAPGRLRHLQHRPDPAKLYDFQGIPIYKVYAARRGNVHAIDTASAPPFAKAAAVPLYRRRSFV